jgi:hypothetical protein
VKKPTEMQTEMFPSTEEFPQATMSLQSSAGPRLPAVPIEFPQARESLQSSAGPSLPAVPIEFPQALESLQSSAGPSLPAVPIEFPQAPKSLQSSAGPELPAVFSYFVDMGGTGAIMRSDGVFITRESKTKKQTIHLSDAQIVKYFRGVPSSDIYTETALLPNGKGLTDNAAWSLEAAGHLVLVRNTRFAKVDRKKTCAAGHDKKSNGCEECTKRDIEALFLFPRDRFYPYRLLRRHFCGSKNVSGSPAAVVNTEINNVELRGVEPPPDMPKELLKVLPESVAVSMWVCANEALRHKWGIESFKRLLAAFGNARNCKSHAIFVRTIDPAKRQRAIKIAKMLFQNLKNGRPPLHKMEAAAFRGETVNLLSEYCGMETGTRK